MGSSGIEYVTDTWGLVVGCDPVSAGCAHCWAARLANRGLHASWSKTSRGGKWTGRVRLRPEVLDEPLRWKKPRRVFVAPMGDIGHESIPDDFLDRVWATMILAYRHTFLVLTKRPARLRIYLQARGRYEAVLAEADAIRRKHPGLYDGGVSDPLSHPPSNVWIGVSCEDQENADYRVPILLTIPAAVRFVSLEPLLGPVRMSSYLVYAPTDATKDDGKRRVPSGSQGGTEDRQTRTGMASSRTPRHALGGWRADPDGETAPRRASDWSRLSSSASDGELGANVCYGAPAGLATLLRADTRRYDDQSQEREEGRQSAEQLGTGHVLREHETRLSHGVERRARGAKPNGEGERRGRDNYPRAVCGRRGDPDRSGGQVRGDVSDDLVHRAGRQPEEAEGPDGRLPRTSPECESDQRREGSVRGRAKIGLVVAGCESGPGARPMHEGWVREIRDACQAAGVPFYYKQARVGNKVVSLPKLDGRQWTEMPGSSWWRAGQRGIGASQSPPVARRKA